MKNQYTTKKVVIENHEFNFAAPNFSDEVAVTNFIKELNVLFKYIDEENFEVRGETLFLKMGDMSDFIHFSQDFSKYSNLDMDNENSYSAQIKAHTGKDAAPLHLVIPEQVNGKNVTLVENLEWLYDIPHVNHLYLPDNLEVIGVSTFINTPLKSVRFGEGLRLIYQGAFRNCQLEEVKIPSSCWYIGDNAFRDNELKSVELSKVTSHIGENAFKDNKISKIDFPESMHILLKGAFEGNLITSVDISKTKIAILEENAFHENRITSIVFGENLGMLSNHCLSNNRIEMLELPEEMQVVQEYALVNNPIKDIYIGKVFNKALLISYSRNAFSRIAKYIKGYEWNSN